MIPYVVLIKAGLRRQSQFCFLGMDQKIPPEILNRQVLTLVG
jgi:hypothetical protein